MGTPGKWTSEQITAAITAATSELQFSALKPQQKEAVLEFVQGKDVFVALPTGFGKSVIFGLLPKVFDHLKGSKGSIVCVVSPLVALMRDLKAKFVPRGISAEFLGELQTDAHAVARVTRGQHQLVFVSPESILDNGELRTMLYSAVYKESLVAVVIDEAHCIDKW